MLPECYYGDHHETRLRSGKTHWGQKPVSLLCIVLLMCKSCLCWNTSWSSAVTALWWSEGLRRWIMSCRCQLALYCVGDNLTLHYSVLHGCSIGRLKDVIKSAGWAIWCSLASPAFLIQQLTNPASSLGSGKTTFYCSDKASYNYWKKEKYFKNSVFSLHP